ncbi:hypothetical protein ACT1UH_00555 [Mycoplasma sp. 332]|uniref:hypothetical protein n=1 Tax=unclassified Asterococcus (in: mycoplasmas, genus) TaxID=3407551 RepID=UPI003F65C8F9
MTKSKLERYYISEKIGDDKKVSFNFKKANQKISGNFTEFVDAVSEFIRVSEKSKNDTRVWFHQDGAYRGSVDIKKARNIIEKILEVKVENEKAIEYIEKEDLVDKPMPVKKMKTTPMIDLEAEASQTTFYVENIETRKASQVSALDVKSFSKYITIIEKVKQLGNTLVVSFHLENEGNSSMTHEYIITGFAEEAMSSCSSCKAMPHNKKLGLWREKRAFLALFTILTLLIIVNIILIVLRVKAII